MIFAPEHLLARCASFLTDEERANPCTAQSAQDFASSYDWPEGEGFGSSDMTGAVKEFLESYVGASMHWSTSHRLERFDANPFAALEAWLALEAGGWVFADHAETSQEIHAPNGVDVFSVDWDRVDGFVWSDFTHTTRLGHDPRRVAGKLAEMMN